MIEQIGSPLEVYDHPANLFVAEFIGSPAMNLLKGEVVGNGVRTVPVWCCPCRKIMAPSNTSRSSTASGRSICRWAPGIAATVSITEPTGPEIHIYADVGGEEICAITEDRQAYPRGSVIELAPRLDKVHLFDAESGKAIA